MALSNYSELQASVASWLERGDMTAVIVDCITLAEARLNRELGPVEDDALLTGTIGQRTLDVSGLSIVEPLSLWIKPVGGGNERRLQRQSGSKLGYLGSNGAPSQWAMDGFSSINLDASCEQAYPFRFHYKSRFALSDQADTNWLLTNHPDVYLAASLMWGAGYDESFANGAVWKSTLEETIPQIKSQLAKSRRTTNRVDSGLVGMASVSAYNIATDE